MVFQSCYHLPGKYYSGHPASASLCVGRSWFPSPPCPSSPSLSSLWFPLHLHPWSCCQTTSHLSWSSHPWNGDLSPHQLHSPPDHSEPRWSSNCLTGIHTKSCGPLRQGEINEVLDSSSIPSISSIG